MKIYVKRGASFLGNILSSPIFLLPFSSLYLSTSAHRSKMKRIKACELGRASAVVIDYRGCTFIVRACFSSKTVTISVWRSTDKFKSELPLHLLFLTPKPGTDGDEGTIGIPFCVDIVFDFSQISTYWTYGCIFTPECDLEKFSHFKCQVVSSAFTRVK